MYIIKSPYTGNLQKPEKITIVEEVYKDYLLLQEYPETSEYDIYEIMVHKSEIYSNINDAYENLVDELIYKVKCLNNVFKNL